MTILYTCLFYAIQPLIWLRLLWRSLKSPDYRKRWLERYGFCKGKIQPNGILVHSVSVGETIAAIPLIKQLQQRYPDLPITITTMTPTGSQQVIKSWGNRVSHVYLPYDLPDAISRFLNTLQPKLVIIMETELWPNLITALYKRHIPLIIANARLSARSARGYAKFKKTMQLLLPKISHIAVQNQFDGQRFIQLGLPESQLTITGSIKFDIHLNSQQQQAIAQLKSTWQLNRPIWIAASTHHGEDDIILIVHKMLLKHYPDLLLILVPRHPERFTSVENLIVDHGLTYQLRSKHAIPTTQTQVILGNTMGELMLLYGLANIAFVGGSMVDRGGHNPLEPALHHLPIIMGKYTYNFKVICEQLINANGLWITETNKQDLAEKISTLLTDNQLRIDIGNNAYQVLKQNQGALQRLLDLIDSTINPIKG
ncbi:lipid IV(A) 3-deoxy-D-manno-octulosonic acid transferase [Frischella sp. Ac48]|uniref:3-deoxy-D-manno-octulosonic acid transferase n=1 Tax=Frischella japonica TaxID=2741544 RepID=A0ABR7QZ42_9GAMM|nr:MULTISPECIES: lipid IV(A) 3-deoxy-D-manno-octulosonic acid transferase [Frischella]MBC9131484.1 lipid IV(A) 3-deoxy-D-manno-octulosonic acid transferase [Frischella japonica]MBX4133938.1 lipid IV(A) 3-deoxy-D-manno-octulosonic acid transferase [Frischella sp. Ac48]